MRCPDGRSVGRRDDLHCISARCRARSFTVRTTAIARLPWIASEPPRRIVALPALRHRPAASASHVRVATSQMMPMTPSGTRIHPTWMPEGRAYEVGDLADRDPAARRRLRAPRRHRLDRFRREGEPVDEGARHARRFSPRRRRRRPREQRLSMSSRTAVAIASRAAFFLPRYSRARPRSRRRAAPADALHVGADVGERAETWERRGWSWANCSAIPGRGDPPPGEGRTARRVLNRVRR